MAETELETLYERFAQRGDVGALAEVFDRVAPELLRLARWLVRDRHRAEDLVQETFLVALERPGTFDRSRPLTPWLVGILVNRARTARRDVRVDAEGAFLLPSLVRDEENAIAVIHGGHAIEFVQPVTPGETVSLQLVPERSWPAAWSTRRASPCPALRCGSKGRAR